MAEQQQPTHLFAQHFAAARLEWAPYLKKRKHVQQRHESSPASDWVYASVFFSLCESEVMHNLRNSSTFGRAQHQHVSGAQASECHRENGTALMVNFECASSRTRCLLQPGRVGSGQQERVVLAGMAGTNRCTMRLPMQVIKKY